MTLRHDELFGPFDGVTVAFQTTQDYVPGTVRAFIPLLDEEANVTEMGGKDVELAEAPLDGDVIVFVYRSFS